jgi:hypothetical protein
MVAFFESLVCLYSTAEFGRWFEMMHFLQYTTSAGSPYLVNGLAISLAKGAKEMGLG